MSGPAHASDWHPNWVARMAARDDWLAQTQEPALEPDREIVDPHHHLWLREGIAYEMPHLQRDVAEGHNVVQSVFIECRSYYDDDAPEPLRPVGETRHVAKMAKAAGAAQPRLAGIVGFADLRLPDLDAVLDAHEAAGQGLFRGIRHAGARDAEPQHLTIPGRGDAGLYEDPDFRRGLARLGERGLTYDTWQYHHQARALIDLARAVPDTVIVLDHLSAPLGVGRFESQREAIFARWQRDMETLATCPNVVAKLGGLAMPDVGYGWHLRDAPPGSDEYVQTTARWYNHMIACFRPDRCMFESNFPVDRISIGYGVLWNAFKKLATDLDAADRNALFAGTARRVYKLEGTGLIP